MLQRVKGTYKAPATARRFRFVLLLIATAAFVFVGIGNALDPPEPGTVYAKENAFGILLVIGQTLPLLITFRYPMAALLIIMVSFTVHAGLNYDVIWVIQFTALLSAFMASTQGGNRQSAFVFFVFTLTIFISFGIFREVDKFGNVLIQMMFFGGLWFIGNLFRTRRLRLETTEQTLANLEAEQDRLAREAVRDERDRIARDLHDIIGHTLNLIVVQAGAAQTVFKSRPDQSLESLGSIETTARQSLSDMERMLGVLRPAEEGAASDAVQSGLGQVERLAAQFNDAGLPVHVKVAGEPRKLPTSLDLCAYRIVQEALTNALKHAGPAHARVAISYLDDKVEVNISDDGRSSGGKGPTTTGGRGLIGMKERVSLFGGELDVGPGVDGGFRVHASLPIQEGH